eukprot:SAG11_NODE_13090_length_670_cov_21.504378_1_plen_219_part_10
MVNHHVPYFHTLVFHTFLLNLTTTGNTTLMNMEQEHSGEPVTNQLRGANKKVFDDHAKKIHQSVREHVTYLELCSQLSKKKIDNLVKLIKKSVINGVKYTREFYNLYLDWLDDENVEWGKGAATRVSILYLKVIAMTDEERRDLSMSVTKKEPAAETSIPEDTIRATAKIVEGKRKREEDAAAAKKLRKKKAIEDAKNKSPRSAPVRPPTPEEYVEIPN